MKTLQTILLFLTASLLFAACGPDTKEPETPEPPTKDADFENRTWQFMGYGRTDTIHLDLPDDAALYTLMLNNQKLTGTTPTDSFTAAYTLSTGHKIQLSKLAGQGTYIQALRNARSYEISNEALKIYYADKQYLLFIEQSEEYPKEITGFRYFSYFPFLLHPGDQLLINSYDELITYCVDPPPPYTPYEWAKVLCADTSVCHVIEEVDFSRYSLVLGCIASDRYLAGYKQRFYRLGENTYYHKLDVVFPTSLDYGTRILYYSVIVDKLPQNTTLIHDVGIGFQWD